MPGDLSADKMESARKLAKKVSGAGRRKSKTPDAGGGERRPRGAFGRRRGALSRALGAAYRPPGSI